LTPLQGDLGGKGGFMKEYDVVVICVILWSMLLS